MQRASLFYAARSIAAGVDAELGGYLALAEALSRSPTLLDDNLDAFETEARRAFPTGGGAWVLIADENGQQLINTRAQPGIALPRRNPVGLEAQRRAQAAGSIVFSDVLRGFVTQEWLVNMEIPVFRDGKFFRGLAVGIRSQQFLPLLSGSDIPRNWLVWHHGWRGSLYRTRATTRCSGWPTCLSGLAGDQRSNRIIRVPLP